VSKFGIIIEQTNYELFGREKKWINLGRNLDLGFATPPEKREKTILLYMVTVLRLRRRVLNIAIAAFAFVTEKSHENFVRIHNVLAKMSFIQKSFDPSVIED
jgi:hypothetical protein